MTRGKTGKPHTPTRENRTCKIEGRVSGVRVRVGPGYPRVTRAIPYPTLWILQPFAKRLALKSRCRTFLVFSVNVAVSGAKRKMLSR